MQQAKNPRIWATVRNNHKVVKDLTLSFPFAQGLSEALTEFCHLLDLERPVVLPKHQREWNDFRRVTFSPRDFIGDFAYDTLEMEYFEDDAPAKKGRAQKQ